MRSTRGQLLLVLVSVLLLAGCLAGANPAGGTADAAGVVAGFWRGLWHGVIAPLAFIVSLFSDQVQLYEVHNNGGWYDFGFVLGITSLHGGGHAARSRARRRALRAPRS